MEWTHTAGDRYQVTGITVYGQRFRIETTNPFHALGINIFRGTLWLVRNNKRTILKRVHNA